MFSNPFTPIFGGKPSFFFGRKAILRDFELAMVEQGSETRALFVTGSRGSGKTALLEQLSQRAIARQKRVIDLGPDDVVGRLVRVLSRADEVTKTVSPQLGASILGIGGSVSAGSVSKTVRYGRDDLQDLLVELCGRERHGLLVTIDELQKIPLDDVSLICNAFQMASRKGYDIMLAVAGLPYAYDEVIHHEGCTYLRRAAHEELGLFAWEEAREAIFEAFASIEGLTIEEGETQRINTESFGHPYLLQLLGYSIVAHINDVVADKTHVVTQEDLEASIPVARAAYERRALRPILDELSSGQLEYLRAMSLCLDNIRTARTAAVARALGQDQRQLSYARSQLLRLGIIAAPERGRVSFRIPLLADYVLRGAGPDANVRVERERGV